MSTPIDIADEPRWTGLKEVSTLAWPIVLSSMSWTFMNFVDTIMVGRLGTAQLAAMGSAALWVFTMNTFILGVTSCVSTFVGQSVGRNNLHDCARYTWQGMYLSFGAVGLSILLWPLSRPMFETMPHSPEVIQYEVEYFQTRLVSYVFIAWQTTLTCFFQATNRPMVPMVTAILANIFNALLAYALIFGVYGFPRWEVTGAAWATNLALGIQNIILIGVFLSPRVNAVYATRRMWQFSWEKSSELFRIGWPAGLNYFLNVANWGIFTSIIVGRFGDAALAAHNTAIQVMHLSFLPALGLNQAVAAIVGQWVGRGDYLRAKARTYTAMRLAIGYMLIMGIFFGVFGEHIIGIFNKSPEIINLGKQLLIMAAIFQGFDAINITVAGALRGAGDTRWMAIFSAIGAYLIFLPLALFIAIYLNLGAIGAWIGATIYIISYSAAFLWRWHSERWRNVSIFAAKVEEPSLP